MSTLAAGQLAVVTIVQGRHTHLRRQREAVRRLDPLPLCHVVVSMGDPGVAAVVTDGTAPETVLVELPRAERLPLAAARNRGVAEAVARGALAVALLDVDCIPLPPYASDMASVLSGMGPDAAVVCGRVRYLPAGMVEDDFTANRMEKVGRDHPLRVVPTDATPVPGDPTMLWSLNLGVRVRDYVRIGGFDERYEGYGGEDTDFGQRLAAVGGQMWWTRGADAFHQYHPTTSPPVQHAADIVRNANLFHATWGWYPMEGWLTAFEEAGLVTRGPGGWALREPTQP